MRIVIDTNVLVSGLLSPYSASAEVVRLVVAGAVVPLYDARILGEYREVLLEREFKIDPRHVPPMLDAFEANGEIVTAAPLRARLPDPDDEVFLEVAFSGKADYVVTFNLKHFPARAAAGVRVGEPRTFLNVWRRLET